MRAILEERNRRLLRDIQALLPLLVAAEVPGELRPYRDQIVAICRGLEVLVTRNLTYLMLGQESILLDVLNVTTQITRRMRLLGARLAPPILRTAPSDRLSLCVIDWLHRSHQETAGYPPAFGDGEVAIWPFLGFGAPLYFFPSVEQRGLLYQPLLFHEFGHLLYARHQAELDDLVGELQRAVHDSLLPASQRNDRHAALQTEQLRAIIDSWYAWAQEFFCDAVGFTIGGPCFLHAFSGYLSYLAETDFYQDPEQLRRSQHPVTWLRIQFLAKRAAREGFAALARGVEEEWRRVANTLETYEDYHGFYVHALEDVLERTIADMLIEAGPRQYVETEVRGGGWSHAVDSPVRLLNWAWQMHEARPEEYGQWESGQIAELLDG